MNDTTVQANKNLCLQLGQWVGRLSFLVSELSP